MIQTLKPQRIYPLDRNEGATPHLSVYFRVLDGKHIPQTIDAIIRETLRLFGNSQKKEWIDAFMRPIQKLKMEGDFLCNSHGSVSLFRSERAFRVVLLPFPTEHLCVLADSFHVKPLIKLSNFSSEFGLVGVNSQGISIYRGSLTSFRKLDKILFHEFYYSPGRPLNTDQRNTIPKLLDRLETSMEWVKAWFSRMIDDPYLPIYFAGHPELTTSLIKNLGHPRMINESLSDYFGKDSPTELCLKIRQIIHDKFAEDLEKNISEFLNASDQQLTQTSISQIAKSATEGRVQTLFVAEDFQIWGRLNRSNGLVSIHAKQRDHQDDDVLDDLAELVIEKGGRVVVAPTPHLPFRKPISAILTSK